MSITILILCPMSLSPSSLEEGCFSVAFSGQNIPNHLEFLIESWTLEFPADLVTLTEEILNGKLNFLCGETFYLT